MVEIFSRLQRGILLPLEDISHLIGCNRVFLLLQIINVFSKLGITPSNAKVMFRVTSIKGLISNKFINKPIISSRHIRAGLVNNENKAKKMNEELVGKKREKVFISRTWQKLIAV